MKLFRTAIMMTTILSSLFFTQGLFAHGDHDHGPTSKTSPNGGRMIETETLHVEVVAKDKEIKIYVYDVDLKPLENLKVLDAKFATKLPRKDKVTLDAKINKDHFLATFDKGSVHRYDLEVTLTHGGHTDTLKWTIE